MVHGGVWCVCRVCEGVCVDMLETICTIDILYSYKTIHAI